MKTSFLTLGTFVVIAVLLFSVGLFLIGDRHKAFSHHVIFYTDILDVNGIAPGSKVRVSGFDAGQVDSIAIPDRPTGKFRLKLTVDEKLHRLIRNDSLVTVESDGLVGDKFIQIHEGTDQSQQADAGTSLKGKEPIEISAVIEKATGVIDQANGTIKDIQAKMNVTFGIADNTINNVNGLVTDARNGKGPVGVILSDQQAAAQLKQTVANAQQASDHINQLTVHAGQLLDDVQSRNLPAKIDETVVNARHASAQLDQVSRQVNGTMNEALGPDLSGDNAGVNLRETLSNVNLTSANAADDTEALKHEFFFRGFFKKRGFFSLQELTPEQYRNTKYFQAPGNRRYWIDTAAFMKDGNGVESLTPAGQQQIDRSVASMKDNIIRQPLVVEGYSNEPSGAEQIRESRDHALLVSHYLEKRYHLRPQDVGVMPLNATPPSTAGKTSWDGASIVLLADKK
jgi:phospholipid/cholesterol/gamma-HCH transport system substrate-binding protein